MCIEIISYNDDFRILSIGYVLLFFITNLGDETIYKNLSIDLFLFSLYPDIYPKIEDWEEYHLKQKNIKMDLEQEKFLSIISQEQSKVILKSLNIIIKHNPNLIYEDFAIALIFYWEERAKGNTQFTI